MWYAGASEGTTKLELVAQEALTSWRQQAERGEMEDHLDFIKLLDAHVEEFPSKL